MNIKKRGNSNRKEKLKSQQGLPRHVRQTASLQDGATICPSNIFFPKLSVNLSAYANYLLPVISPYSLGCLDLKKWDPILHF